MSVKPFVAAVSRRAVRVALLTLLLISVGCMCDENNPLSECLPGIERTMPCLVPTGNRPCVKVDYVEAGCSSCSHPLCVHKSMNLVSSAFDSTCVGGNCGLVCGVEDANCD
jgi:hypothetical protein